MANYVKLDTIGYKKCIYLSEREDKKIVAKVCIVQLLIPEGAKIANFRNRDVGKMRCSKAMVKAIFTTDRERLNDETIAYSIICADIVTSWSSGNRLKRISDVIDCIKEEAFHYIVGKKVTPAIRFDDDSRRLCSSGIHFFKTFREACEYDGLNDCIKNINECLIGGEL